jgi:hypothetical protein
LWDTESRYCAACQKEKEMELLCIFLRVLQMEDSALRLMNLTLSFMVSHVTVEL